MASGPLPLSGGLRILVVDDHQDGADSLCMLFKVFGHQARACYRSADAMMTCQDFRPQVVFLEPATSDFEGFELAGQLRAVLEDLEPVIVALTGLSSEADRQRARPHFDHYLVKPADPAYLEQFVAGLTGRR
jgi:DNA-binding response OmpR family regulator